jgi:L-glutamine:2-deoxy-scyllo-inosose/3-amino-2,3-dideoxy-scyllo-inosose aminotransferase
MSHLAIRGGEPVRHPRKSWPAWPPVTERAVELVTDVVRSGQWSFDGPREWQFAQAYAAWSGARYCLPVANGTVALQLALESLGIGAYDEVLVPGLTWQATAAACIDVNAVPVLVDVDPETWCLDAARAEAAITPRTRAIMLVHLYGSMADVDAILDLAERKGLRVVEDCAHQHGSRWDGRSVGTLGSVGAFSLQQSKVLTSGEGGMVLTDDWTLCQLLYSLRNCGRPFGPGAPTLQSGNYRMTELQAALLLAQMETLPSQVELRDRNGRRVDGLLAGIPGVHPMKRHPKVTTQSCYCYSFRYDPAAWDGIGVEAFRKALAAETGLGVGGTYEPLHHCSLYRPQTKPRHKLGDDYWRAIDPTRFSLPVCERAFREESVVIHHPFLLADAADVSSVAAAVAKIREHREELRGLA